MKKYYHAYDERYKTIHEKGYSWASDNPTPLVNEILIKYQIDKKTSILEIGCGEGRDSIVLLKNGYNLKATDSSMEAISYCQNRYREYKDKFIKLDFINDEDNQKYDFIYAIAVLHMLVEDEDRKSFYSFIYQHLNSGGLALITSMGDGEMEMESDINTAFNIIKREHPSGEVAVASTSCRIVNFDHFMKEAEDNNFEIMEKGISEALPDFDKLMFLLIKKK